MALEGTFIDIVQGLIGTPGSFAASIMIYTIVAIMLLRILEMSIEIVYVLIKKV